MKQLRQKAGLTQEDLAMFLNVSRAKLNMVEMGRRSLEPSALILLAELFTDLQKLENGSDASALPQDIQEIRGDNEKQAVAQMKIREKAWLYSVQKQEKNLADMQAMAAQLKNWLIVIERKLQHPAPGPASEWQTKCFANFKVKARDQLMACDEPMQLEASIKIAALKASIREWRKIKRKKNLLHSSKSAFPAQVNS
ncbi:MAG: hypothetical protein JWQ27_3329 [Ferruginibacter sp.]|nr:hypothetical protein [Ferruginibacter sp.]